MVGKRKGKKSIRGGSFWGDVWDGVKSVGSFANDIAKKTGIISKVASATGNPIIGSVAGALGYGKKRKGMKGRGRIKIINA